MVDQRLLTLYAATTLICMVYGLITPFLPIIAEQKNMHEWETGIIFASHPLAGLIFSPFIGSFLYKVGRRNMIAISFLCTAIALVASGASTSFEKPAFFAANIVSRALTGIAGVGLFADVIAIITSDYPDNVFQYAGYLQSSGGLGLLLGPLAGAGLYMGLGFSGSFFVSAASYLLSGIFIFVILGPDRDYRIISENEHILRLALRPRLLATMLPLVFGMSAMSAQSMFIATHLQHHGLSTSWVAATFALSGIGFLISCVILLQTISSWNKKVANALGCGVSLISIALVGPWPNLLPDSLPVILTGFAMTQLGLGILLIEIVPSLIEVATKDLAIQQDDKLTDKLSAIETLGVVFGEFLGPLFMGGLIAAVGISESCGIFAGIGLVVLLTYSCIFLLTSSAPPVSSDNDPEALLS